MNNEYDVWFSNIDISNQVKLKLLENFNSKDIWYLKEEVLYKIKIKEKDVLKILDKNIKINFEKYLRYMEKNNIKLISYKDEAYPTLLNNIKNKPAYLYVRGEMENLYGDLVAIVGSRLASNYGKFVARKIAKELADRNINIVSGLAIGIDKFAHLGALDSNIGRTVAVLGTGVSDNEIYPYENRKVFERILENNGTIISEFNLGTKPEKYNFPLRNRIISGIAKKLIVVEAEEKSGTAITVEYALDQGRDVYAVPGNITSKKSIGTNKLIKEGAYILTDFKDIFE